MHAIAIRYVQHCKSSLRRCYSPLPSLFLSQTKFSYFKIGAVVKAFPLCTHHLHFEKGFAFNLGKR